VRFTDHGTLVGLRPPGELFAAFSPQPKEIDQDVVSRVFALLRQLESETKLPPPTTMAVFRLYCMEALSAAQVARECGCSKATVLNRLALIRSKTGIDPAQLRTFSPHIGKLQAQLSDPRAGRIHRESGIDEENQ
jgi:hypothetical protein